MHMTRFSTGGAGVFATETMAVNPEGHFSDRCLGWYSKFGL